MSYFNTSLYLFLCFCLSLYPLSHTHTICSFLSFFLLSLFLSPFGPCSLSLSLSLSLFSSGALKQRSASEIFQKHSKPNEHTNNPLLARHRQHRRGAFEHRRSKAPALHLPLTHTRT